MHILTRSGAKPVPRKENAPQINPEIQKQLTAIGGIVPPEGGHYAGQPVYRLAWGQTEQHFSRGRMRVRFPDEDEEEIIVQERFFVAPEVFQRVAVWQEKREKNRVEKFLTCDYSMFTEFEPVSSYLKQTESSLDYMQIADAVGTREEVEGDFLGIAKTVAPKDWLYLCDVKEVTEIGKKCWFIMRWISSKAHGGRAAWEKLRYTTDAYVPELNAVVPLVDDLGEFPENGFYIPRFEIADYQKDEFGSYDAENFNYAEPTRANAVEPVIQELYEMAQLTRQQKNREFRAKQNEEEMVKRRDRAARENLEKVSGLLDL